MTTSKLTLEQADLNKVDSGRHTPISGFDRDTMTGFAKLNDKLFQFKSNRTSYYVCDTEFEDMEELTKVLSQYQNVPSMIKLSKKGEDNEYKSFSIKNLYKITLEGMDLETLNTLGIELDYSEIISKHKELWKHDKINSDHQYALNSISNYSKNINVRSIDNLNELLDNKIISAKVDTTEIEYLKGNGNPDIIITFEYNKQTKSFRAKHDIDKNKKGYWTITDLNSYDKVCRYAKVETMASGMKKRHTEWVEETEYRLNKLAEEKKSAKELDNKFDFTVYTEKQIKYHANHGYHSRRSERSYTETVTFACEVKTAKIGDYDSIEAKGWLVEFSEYKNLYRIRKLAADLSKSNYIKLNSLLLDLAADFSTSKFGINNYSFKAADLKTVVNFIKDNSKNTKLDKHDYKTIEELAKSIIKTKTNVTKKS